MIKDLRVIIEADDVSLDTSISSANGRLTTDDVSSIFRYAEYFVNDKVGRDDEVDNYTGENYDSGTALTEKIPVVDRDNTDEIRARG